MKYKVGDKVRVREWEYMEKNITFMSDELMKIVKHRCGEIVTIQKVIHGFYKINDDADTIWCEEMFEDVERHENHWEEIAGWFGLELDEEFDIEDALYNPYKFTEKGLIRCGDIFDNKMLQNLINGDNHVMKRDVKKK